MAGQIVANDNKIKKMRIDHLLVERKMAPSRQKAQALIMAGCVLVDDVPVDKVGRAVDPRATIRIRGGDHPFVSRGGVKLAHAIEEFGCDIEGHICMDVGASTGGFTDCMLQNGASRVYAIDVGYGQMDSKVARDERVVVIERTNFRRIEPSRVPEEVGFVAVDVSFISLSLILPVVNIFLARGGDVIALIKPQFEVGRENVGKGGIVRDGDAREGAIEKVKEVGEMLGWRIDGVIESPITGAKGNVEYLIHFKKS